MKMSQENYLRFKEFFDLTVETATDDDMEVIFATLAMVAQKMLELEKQGLKNHKKPSNKHSA